MVRQVLALDEENPTPVHRLAYACAEDPAHAPPPTLLEETLLEEDRAATDRRRASLKLGPFERDGLGLAFSGGGVRAASFQSGVLWSRRAPRRRDGSRLPRRRSSAGSARRRRSARTARCYHHGSNKKHFFRSLAAEHAISTPPVGTTPQHAVAATRYLLSPGCSPRRRRP